MFGRFVERRAEEALSDTPVVLIVVDFEVNTAARLGMPEAHGHD